MTSDKDRVFELYKHMVLRLSLSTKSPNAPENQEFLGNAFIVYCKNGRCLVMTCAHCLLKETENLKKNQKYRLDFSKLSIPGFEADVVCRDAERDLAILRANGLQQELDHVTFVDGDRVIPTGKDVVLVAFYEMHGQVLYEPGTMDGKIVGLPDTSDPKCHFIRANYTSKKGTSGAPVILLQSRTVAGVQCEGEVAAKYAISTQSVKAALRNWTKSDENVSIENMLEVIAING